MTYFRAAAAAVSSVAARLYALAASSMPPNRSLRFGDAQLEAGSDDLALRLLTTDPVIARLCPIRCSPMVSGVEVPGAA